MPFSTTLAAPTLGESDALAALAGGAAHEFNNQLQTIHAYATFVLEEAAGDSRTASDARQVLAAADRSVTSVRLLRLFSRSADDVADACSANDLIEAVRLMWKRAAPLTTTLDVTPLPCDLMLRCSPRTALEMLGVTVRDACTRWPEAGLFALEVRSEPAATAGRRECEFLLKPTDDLPVEQAAAHPPFCGPRFEIQREDARE